MADFNIPVDLALKAATISSHPAKLKPSVEKVNSLPYVADLPPQLENLDRAIQKSRYMLDFPDNWDEEGSPAYSVNTWNIAVFFISNYAAWVLDTFKIVIPTPKILHGPNGSIDLFWKQDHFNLLINIPASKDENATFYGDDYGTQKVEGSFNPENFKQVLFPSLFNL